MFGNFFDDDDVDDEDEEGEELTADVDIIELWVGDVIVELIVDTIVELLDDVTAWLDFGIFGIVYFVFVDDLNKPVPDGPIFAKISEADDKTDEDGDDWLGGFVLVMLILRPSCISCLTLNCESIFRLYFDFSEADFPKFGDVKVLAVEPSVRLMLDGELISFMVMFWALVALGKGVDSLPAFSRRRSTTAVSELFLVVAFWLFFCTAADNVPVTGIDTRELVDCWEIGCDVIDVWICFGDDNDITVEVATELGKSVKWETE